MEAVDYALELGLQALAITDHDTMAGVPEAEAQAEDLSIEIIPGVEISCELDGAPVHLLAYWPDLTSGDLGRELAEIRESRRTRVGLMVQRLNDLGYSITVERVMHFAQGGNPGRPHVAEALVEAGVISRVADAFTPELIGNGGKGYVPKYTLEPARAVKLVRDANGVPVLAHPGLGRGAKPVPDGLIRSMANAGLGGIEATHIDHTPEQVEAYKGLASELGLVATSGSDCHGALYDPIRMGTCRAGMEVVTHMRDRLGFS
jgi:predicted metal-dependent phosphoesterase TrpH